MEEIKRVLEYIFLDEDSSNSGKRPEGRKERYYVEDHHSYRQFPEKDVVPANSFRSSVAPNSSINPRTDWQESPSAYFFMLDLPGVKKHEVKLEIENNEILCISRDFGAEREKMVGFGSRLRRGNGKIYWRLPDRGNKDEVSAEMHNGVLIVSVPKYILLRLKCHYRKHKTRLLQMSGD